MTTGSPRRGPDWRWRTFPVLAAFVVGALVASFLDRPDSDFAVGVRVMLVLAVAYCLAHIGIAYFVLPRRVRSARNREHNEDGDYEDELVLDARKES